MQVHTCYRIAKGSEISVYWRVCPKPSSPYLKKGMLPRLQGTIKLKAVSRLFGRMPRMQGRSAWAERPVCRHISATLLTLQATSCEELTHWKRRWCWEGLGAGGEGDDRGWDGWMASLTWWAWVWVNSGNWWWTESWHAVIHGVARSWTRLSDWTELNWISSYLQVAKQTLLHHELIKPPQNLTIYPKFLFLDVLSSTSLWSPELVASYSINSSRIKSFYTKKPRE